MGNTNVVKGIVLIAIALFFGIQALWLPIGTLGQAGPGLFPLMVSSLLLVVALAIILRSRFVAAVRLDARFRNIAIVAASLVLFALASEYVNMLTGLFAMVFLSAMASGKYNVVRNLKIACGLALVAFLMQKALGFQLPLF